MADTIQTISPETVSHNILRILRNHILHKKLTERYFCIAMKSADFECTMRERDPNRLSPVQISRRLGDLYGIGDPFKDGCRHYLRGWTQAELRLVNSGLIHVRWCWLNTVDDKNELLIPDFCITDKGIKAIEYLDSGAYFILSWGGIDLNKSHTPVKL